jgi:hypothetical protein
MEGGEFPELGPQAASLSAAPLLEKRNAQLLRIYGEISGDAGTREDDDALGQDFEHAVVALEGSGLAVAPSPA